MWQGTSLAVFLALISTLGFGAAFVLTQFGLRRMAPWLGAAFSIPTSTLLFWCLAPFSIDMAQASIGTGVLFGCIGLFFPALVTLLNFESNRLMGPNIAGALAGLAPVFAVILAVIVLRETIRLVHIISIGAIAGGVMLMYQGRQRVFASARTSALLLPLAAAAIRGAVQPVIKLGLESWPNPIAAAVIGYTVSSAVLILSALIRNRQPARSIELRGVLWFAAVGICNGLAVLAMYAALGAGPVIVVSPLVASYPLITVLLSRFLLKEESIDMRLVAAVTITIGGVVLLLIA
jgi:drug/metabolite transporter (DMT)-like permease